MQINFKGTNYELDAEVSERTQRKIEGLKKFLGKGAENARAYVDLGKETEAHQNGKIWRADINFDVDGTRFYAKAVDETLENAIDVAVRELASELRTARKKQITLFRKGGGAFKQLSRQIWA